MAHKHSIAPLSWPNELGRRAALSSRPSPRRGSAARRRPGRGPPSPGVRRDCGRDVREQPHARQRRPARTACRRRSVRSVRGTTRAAAARPARRWPALRGRTAPSARGTSVGTDSTSSDCRNRTLLAWSGESTCSKSPPAARPQLRLLLPSKYARLCLAEPAGHAQPARRRRPACLPQPDVRVDEDVQPLLRSDAGEVADRERRLGPRLRRLAVALEVDAGDRRRRSSPAGGRGSRPCSRRSTRHVAMKPSHVPAVARGSGRSPAARCSAGRASRKMSSPWSVPTTGTPSRAFSAGPCRRAGRW